MLSHGYQLDINAMRSNMLELAQNLLALTEKEKMFFDTIYSGEGLG